MRRRVLPPEPFAAAAIASRRAGAFAILLALMAVGLGRGGVEPRSAVAVLAAALLFALAALLLAVAAAVTIWRTGRRGAGRVVTGVGLALLVLAYPAWLGSWALRLPLLDDESTDLAAPPAFSNSAQALAARGGFRHGELSAGAREAQHHAYPNLQPVMLDVEAEEAYKLVMGIVAARGWRMIDAAPPQGRFGVGHVDAVARSRVMAFPEDVTIRLRPSGGQTRIDIRIASRFEPHDFGTHAAMITALSDDLQDAQ